MIYYAKARLKDEFLRAGRRMQCLLRPGWKLTDYSIQLDWCDWPLTLQSSLQPRHVQV